MSCKDATENKDATSDSGTGFSISGTITLPQGNCISVQKNDPWRVVVFHSVGPDQPEITDDIVLGTIDSEGANSFSYSGLKVLEAGTYIIDAAVNKTGNFGNEQIFFTGVDEVYIDSDKVVNLTLFENGCS